MVVAVVGFKWHRRGKAKGTGSGHATMTLTAGTDIYTTSKLLGHTSVHTTEIYADVVMEKKADAVNLTNGLFG